MSKRTWTSKERGATAGSSASGCRAGGGVAEARLPCVSVRFVCPGSSAPTTFADADTEAAIEAVHVVSVSRRRRRGDNAAAAGGAASGARGAARDSETPRVIVVAGMSIIQRRSMLRARAGLASAVDAPGRGTASPSFSEVFDESSVPFPRRGGPAARSEGRVRLLRRNACGRSAVPPGAGCRVPGRWRGRGRGGQRREP